MDEEAIIIRRYFININILAGSSIRGGSMILFY